MYRRSNKTLRPAPSGSGALAFRSVRLPRCLSRCPRHPSGRFHRPDAFPRRSKMSPKAGCWYSGLLPRLPGSSGPARSSRRAARGRQTRDPADTHTAGATGLRLSLRLSLCRKRVPSRCQAAARGLSLPSATTVVRSAAGSACGRRACDSRCGGGGGGTMSCQVLIHTSRMPWMTGVMTLCSSRCSNLDVKLASTIWLNQWRTSSS